MRSLCLTTLVFICWGGPLEPSNALLSSILSKRCPSVLASIFIPLSLVVTASNEPSLLNLKRGLACKISLQQCQAKSFSMVTGKLDHRGKTPPGHCNKKRYEDSNGGPAGETPEHTALTRRTHEKMISMVTEKKRENTYWQSTVTVCCC